MCFNTDPHGHFRFAAIEVVFIGAAISAETQSTGGQVGNSTMTG